MNAFERARQVERLAVEELMPWLIATSENVEMTDASEFLQKVWGDFVATRKDQRYAIELKAERKHTGNLFLELWSNKKWFTQGWIYTCRADYLFYYFVEKKILYILDMKKLKAWLFGDKDNIGALYSGRFKEKVQGASDQPNDTWGLIVSVDVLKSEVGMAERTDADRKLQQANAKGLIVLSSDPSTVATASK